MRKAKGNIRDSHDRLKSCLFERINEGKGNLGILCPRADGHGKGIKKQCLFGKTRLFGSLNDAACTFKPTFQRLSNSVIIKTKSNQHCPILLCQGQD